MLRYISILFIAMIIVPALTLPVLGQSSIYDVSKVSEYTLQMKMYNNGTAVGDLTISLKKNKGQWILKEETEVPNFTESISSYINAKTLQADSLSIEGTMSNFPIDIKMVWKEGSVKGSADFPKHPDKPTVHVDESWDKSKVLRTNSFYLLPFIKGFGKSLDTNYQQFNPTDGKTRSIHVKTEQLVDVKINDKTYSCYEIRLRGGIASQNIFIDKSTQEIIKMTFENSPWVFEKVE